MTSLPTLLLASALWVATGAQPNVGSQDAARGLVEAAVARSRQVPGSIPSRLVTVTRVIDGDTIHVERDGRTEKLRLLSVDTEEKITGRPVHSPSKPETVFGQESALWAQAFFRELGEPARVGLRFPHDREERDVYGRLLCHVILPDGRDFNLLLVELGFSPYFNKYGNSRIAHAAFVEAQEHARAEALGIWDPATNLARAGATSAKRPYSRLLPWWNARAEAIEAFRRAKENDPESIYSSEDADGLAAAVQRADQVEVFGTLFRLHDEDDGSLTAEFRATDPERSFRVVLPAGSRTGEFEARLRTSMDEFRQNHWIVRGKLTRGPRGPRMSAVPARWRLAGTEVDGAR